MSKKLQLRRGTTVEHAGFTGAEGEITFDTNKKVAVLHDGVTAGGVTVATEKNMLATTGAQADGISGFVDRDLDLEISETNAIIGIKNRYVKFGNEIVDLYDAQGNYKSIDLADTVPGVQTIGSTPLSVTDSPITDTDVAKNDVVGTDATIPAHNNGHQTKITCNVTATSNGMEVQILDKSNANNKIRTQTLDSHESKKALEFWLPANADGYLVHCIKRTNVGSGDESIVVTAKGFEDLVTTDIVAKSDYAVVDLEDGLTNRNDIFRATEDIPLGTSVYDSRFQVRDYVSNQQLVTLKQDLTGTVTTHTETLFEDATETDVNLDRDNVMLKNGFSMKEDGLFTKGTDKYLPVGLWQTLNKGAYHPVFNGLGCSRIGRDTTNDGLIDNAIDWYKNWYYTPVGKSAYDFFKIGHYGQGGTISNDYSDSGFLSSGAGSGRPDSKSSDAVYRNQFIPLYNTIQEDTLLEAEKRRSAYYAGKGGVSGLVSTYSFYKGIVTVHSEGITNFIDFGADVLNGLQINYDKNVPFGYMYDSNGVFNAIHRVANGRYCYTKDLTQSVVAGECFVIFYKTLPVLSNDSHLTTDIIGDPSQYKSTDALYTLPTSLSITNMPLNTLVWDEATGKMYKALVATNDIDVNGVPVPLFTDTASWTLVQKGYPTSWLSRLAESKPLVGMYANLVNVNDGSSAIPAGVAGQVITGSNKTTTALPSPFTTNSRVTWSVDSTVRLDGIDNSFTATYAIGNLFLCPNIVKNIPLVQTIPKPIEYISPKEVNTNSYSIYKGNLITNAVTGGIATSNGAVDFESKVLENGEIDNVGTIVTTPKHTTPTLTSSTSKASKSFFTTAKDSKGVYDMILGQGMVDATGYHSTKFTNLTNGTTLDDVGTTVNTKVLAVQTQYRR